MKTVHTHYAEIPAYITKDGSEIRELMHPDIHATRNQSLAEALIHPGQKTELHMHHKTEEIYHITTGNGLMTLDEHHFQVAAGDTIVIQPGTAHCICNTGDQNLHILCSCSPAYSHEDTTLLKDKK